MIITLFWSLSWRDLYDDDDDDDDDEDDEDDDDDDYQQEMPSEALARGAPKERLQNNIIIKKKFLPKALARSLPTKGSRTRLLLTGNASQSSCQRATPGEAPEQDN